MSLPTAHNYIIRELKKNIDAMYTDFLKPEVLIQHISNIETTLNRDIQNLDIKDFSNNIEINEKVELSEFLEKIETLEKAANHKINWANKFSKFLEQQSNSK
jgi:hypothetical protein